MNRSPSGPEYRLNDNGEFIISDYNHAKPLANFFPGIAGTGGVPMWVFYVNRGQAISSFGTDGKDSAILEFQPANKAWQTTSLHGFRTFIKGKNAGKDFFYEPFHNGIANREYRIANHLSMSSCELSLFERNATLGLEVRVRYFSIPGEPFAALARIVSIRNTGRRPLRLQMLDGLPQIVPYGENNFCLKEISRTIEAWMRVENLERGVPVYRLSVDPGDRPQVVHIHRGNFYLGFMEEEEKSRIIKPIVDPDCIFGPINDFSAPRNFVNRSWNGSAGAQQIQSKTPCGFLPLELRLKPKEEKSFNAVIGTVRETGMLEDICRRVLAPGYLDGKADQNRKIIADLASFCRTSSSASTFDRYCGQTFLDNILRGGFPLVFRGTNDRTRVFYLYSRKHGDLERDYNRFQIQDTYFSQGNGNYRDVNQNRRCDVWFNPAIRHFNLDLFMNLIQSDGYNPLIVKGCRFVLLAHEEFAERARPLVPGSLWNALLSLVEKPFTPGEIALFLEEKGIIPEGGVESFLSLLLPLCAEINEAEHGEGYWIDHWHYNLDLLESYLSLYPEHRRELLFEAKHFTFFDNDAVIARRSAKYVLLNGAPRQLHSVIHDKEKRALIDSRAEHKHLSRTDCGKGDILRVSLFAKLFCVFVNKYASLDPFGTGIEMEADKPNWFDALNGLPALFGSSSCESLELKRLIRLMADSLAASGIQEIALPGEIADFFQALQGITDEWAAGHADADLVFWQKSGSAKEEYRAKTRFGFSGSQRLVSCPELISGLEKAVKRIDEGLRAAYDKKAGIYCAYFMHEVVSYETLPGNHIKPLKFRQRRLPFFLEGQMHALRVCGSRAEAKKLHESVRRSELYDEKLKMYKVTAPLGGMPEEIGRCRVFTPGWLENESIWLHMEYKYLLELLKRGLCEEFFADFRNTLIPFQDPATYGRSILENSSFLVSSAFPYPRMHGNGFVARLSGSTAEFVQMWLIMNAGRMPFSLDDRGRLVLKLDPILPGWLFKKKEKTYSFRFLGSADVTYRNPSLKDTFGADGCRVKKITLTDSRGNTAVIDSGIIPSPLAEKVRAGEIAAIEALLE